MNIRNPLPQGASIEIDEWGFPFLVLRNDSGQVFFAVCFQGAQVRFWQPAGLDPVLWESANSLHNAGDSFRYGVPICFPNFGPNEGLPTHGFARLLLWMLGSVNKKRDGSFEILFELRSSAATKVFWPGDFKLIERITVGPASPLHLAPVVHNTGENPLNFELVLHGHLDLGDLDQQEVTIIGLAGMPYLDKVDGQRKVQTAAFYPPSPFRIQGHVDRVYFAPDAVVRAVNQSLGLQVTSITQGAGATALWHPDSDKGAKLADVGRKLSARVFGLEVGNCLDARVVDLPPGRRSGFSQTFIAEKV